ncbi:MAG: Lrp/AsnC family transcriptional regulator [Candidatus Abyssobacteria bacterium SURF_17]|jgi:DNA-binding Lrp family transcriptional regulator|uniref:Lrp/AsnC family transcriptional regulator n=1 Tax=Candidatus Abyssobacteria bacterium SURF_17 TaxID=2093361 RepID=A0A419ER37_9BACT|nr:MAG: Lrp/AsnC family transcriptional regulator [Candidatus Abyssubacteria bacterium SURF_17]
MAISAYVFVECTQGKAIDVSKKLTKLSGVKAAHAVTGPIDVIAFIEAADINDLGRFVVEKIQSTAGVLRTSTNIVTG